jgi:hypothetical protein
MKKPPVPVLKNKIGIVLVHVMGPHIKKNRTQESNSKVP